MRLTSLIREFPSRKVNNHLDIEVDTLSHKLLNTDNLHLVGAGRERVLGGQVQLCQLGVGEAVHLATGNGQLTLASLFRVFFDFLA